MIRFKSTISSPELLTICGTYRRPELVYKMLKSFFRTKSYSTDIVVYISNNDTCVIDYITMFDAMKVNYIVSSHRYFTQAINYIVEHIFPEIPYYQAINDDHVYHTYEWDKLMIDTLESKAKGYGWAYPNDMVANGKLNIAGNPSSEIFSWKLVKALGYVYPEGFRQFGPDLWAKRFLKEIGGDVYVPQVEIEHLCGYITKKVNVDDNYSEAYKSTEQAYGKSVVEAWFKTEFEGAKKRIEIAKVGGIA